MEEKKLFKVVITAIVVKPARPDDSSRSGGDAQYLILKRSPNEKKFPNRWTVPGGKLSTADYVTLPKDTPDYWYNVLERTLRREVKEESGLAIANIRYVTSLADLPAGRQVHDEYPSLVISCLADWTGGEVKLDRSMVDFRWVTLGEAKNIDLIEGIYEELAMADRMLKGQDSGEWSSGATSF